MNTFISSQLSEMNNTKLIDKVQVNHFDDPFVIELCNRLTESEERNRSTKPDLVWFEVIPTLCGNTFAIESDINCEEFPLMSKSKNEILESIEETKQDFLDNHMDEYEGFAQLGYLVGDHIIFVDELTHEHYEITNWKESR